MPKWNIMLHKALKARINLRLSLKIAKIAFEIFFIFLKNGFHAIFTTTG